LDPVTLRTHFPALERTYMGQPIIYFDGPGGTQVPRSCSDAIVDYLSTRNANHGGVFVTSVESDCMVEEAHEAMADFLNARRAEEIVFGANMTSLTFALSRSIGATLKAGDEVIVTRLDHDANFSPWILMARDHGASVRVADIREEDCTLDLQGFERCLSSRTRLVAVGYASNAVGTINPVEQIIRMSQSVGALTFIDAVHFAPHGPIDVRRLGCDFLACSPYKFFGPHLGVLYGRYELLESLPAYKVRPAGDQPPHKFETGTQNHEALAGLLGTVQYLGSLAGSQDPSPAGQRRSGRSARLWHAMRAIEGYESSLKAHMLEGLLSMHGIRLYGLADPARLAERVPTFAIRIAKRHPQEAARLLAERSICVWDGNYYAINLTERLGLEDTGGMVRIGLVHYNTHEEIDRFLKELASIAC
jgi:cysteine desulfurase family protein (TIGR01976 family)